MIPVFFPRSPAAHAGMSVLARLASLTMVAACVAVAGCATTSTAPTVPAPKAEAPGAATPGPSGKLRVGVNPLLPPVIFKEGGKFDGFEADFARGLAKSMGREVQFVELKWVELLPALQAGRVDILMTGMSVTSERQMIVDFTQPYLRSGLATLMRRERAAALTYFFNKNVKIGVKPGTTGEFYAQQNFPKNPLKTYRNPREGAEAVKSGAVEIFLIDAPTAWFLAGEFQSAGISVGEGMLSTEYLGWAVRKGDEATLNAANACLSTIEQSGEKHRIMQRWLGAFYQP